MKTKEYTIKLDEEMNLISSDGEQTNELGLVLQIWQDLNKIGSSSKEDILIKKILEQILEKEFNDKSNIPMPDYY